jgi:hypothetical protein
MQPKEFFEWLDAGLKNKNKINKYWKIVKRFIKKEFVQQVIIVVLIISILGVGFIMIPLRAFFGLPTRN